METVKFLKKKKNILNKVKKNNNVLPFKKRKREGKKLTFSFTFQNSLKKALCHLLIKE